MKGLINKLIINPNDEHLAKELAKNLHKNGYCDVVPAIEVSKDCKIEEAYFINGEGKQVVIKIRK